MALTCLLIFLAVMATARVLGQITNPTTTGQVVSPTTVRSTSSISRPVSTIDLLVIMTPTEGPKPTILASAVHYNSLRRQTEFRINCPQPPDDTDHPCYELDSADVTVNPTGMTLSLSRGSTIVEVSEGTASTYFSMSRVEATGSCHIATVEGTASASCGGALTDLRLWSQYSVDSSLSFTSVLTSTSTNLTTPLTTAFADIEAHYVQITVTAGLGNMPSPGENPASEESSTTTTTTLSTSESKGAASAARAIATGGAAWRAPVVAAGAVVAAAGWGAI